LSHRTAGPLYAFERFIEDTLIGRDRILKLRQGDEFPHLEELAIKIRETFISHGILTPSDSPVTISEPESIPALGLSSEVESELSADADLDSSLDLDSDSDLAKNEAKVDNLSRQSS
ncbi:MAG: hypothetical protein KDD35_06520, partial [Bdellovibrionales bacterium]|nr:hypothetical protein [Bdellovibrionales bacterium]